MPLIASAASAFRIWLRSVAPTREAIVTAGCLAIVFGLTYLAAYFTRSELLLQGSDAATIVRTIGWVVLLKLFVFYTRGICHRSLRTIRFADLSILVRATTTCLLVLVAANYYFTTLRLGWIQIPRTVLLLDWAFTLLAVGGLQAAARSIYEELMPAEPVGHQRNALVIDGSPQGLAIAAQLMSAERGGYFVSGLLDDDPTRHGSRTAVAPVIGGIDHVAACAQRLRVTDVIVRSGSVFGRRLRRICEACTEIGVRVVIAEPCGEDADVRVRGVELRDLVTRPDPTASAHGPRLASWVHDKTVMVTGAGGAIGAEICRLLVTLRPARILLVDRSECSLFEIHRELQERAAAFGEGEIGLVLGLVDIQDTERLEDVFQSHRPAIVIHAAGYKHVPMLQGHPVEAIENNILATAALADLAEGHGVETFVALSTDKAVNPTGVMGASKLVAERFLQSLGEGSTTKFVVVRFGNVIGSSGTAVPIFTRQLVRRQPITVTHPDVARRFLTASDAARLSLAAGALAGGSGTFILDMCEPVKIVELVKCLAFVMRVPREEVEIRFGGLRDGEKLAEELFFDDEIRHSVGCGLVFQVSRPIRPLAEVRQWLGDLKAAILADGPDAARGVLMEIAALECMASSVGTAPLGEDHDPRESRS
ncbi:MAG: polysaccharide biosynthesis protein [Planctomycetaceae bacterium]|nr:polysaccharide biosynthesis protein [Planctomycetaceae bacterium]